MLRDNRPTSKVDAKFKKKMHRKKLFKFNFLDKIKARGALDFFTFSRINAGEYKNVKGAAARSSRHWEKPREFFDPLDKAQQDK